MLSQTRRALQDFDNQHDFERLAADVLNAQGYTGVEPMAPSGGPDGGRDTKFMDGNEEGRAFVTLDKRIQAKFSADLAKQAPGQGVIALFCNVAVSPSQKLAMAQEAFGKGYRTEFFDVERLRSLLDSSLKDVRRRYLGIDDEVAGRIRSEVSKLLRYPAALPDESVPPTMIEGMVEDVVPRRLFELLMHHEEGDIAEVPEIGDSLREYLRCYYDFRSHALETEEAMTVEIGKRVSCRFITAWRIYLRYVLLRFAGYSREDIEGMPRFLNYDITYDDAERVYGELAGDTGIASRVSGLFKEHVDLAEKCESLSSVTTG
jgi:hypothetical protein